MTCGYNEVYNSEAVGGKTDQQGCYIFYRHWGYWVYLPAYDKFVLFEGAFFPWHNRLVLFGGSSYDGRRQSTARYPCQHP